MAPVPSIAKLVKARYNQHRQEVQNDLKDELEAITEAASEEHPADANALAQRPFGIPLGHDPYDVWNLILENVTDQSEVLKAWEVCPLFRELWSLERMYVQTRLPQIVKLILTKRPLYLLENAEEEQRPEGFGPVMTPPSPSQMTLLNLRKVSTRVKTSVEEVLQPTGHGLQASKLYLKLDSIQKVQDIVDGILGEGISVDSFFPGNVEVDESHYSQHINIHARDAFLEGVGILLELLGNRIKTFSYKSYEQVGDAYENLRKHVLHLPNLETLEFQSVYFSWIGFDEAFPSFEDIAAFPNCPHLKTFVHPWKVLPQQYLHRILHANPQIKVLSLPKYSPASEFPDLREMSQALQHLECLHTPLFEPTLSCLELGMPLKQIEFFKGSRDHRRVSSTELFKFLHQFRNTLEHLELDLSVDDGAGKYFLDLPKLRFFKWKSDKTFKDLYFLMLAGRLEEIQMVVTGNVGETKAFCDRFMAKAKKGFDGMSLWEVFPWMKSILIKFSARRENIELYRP